MNRPDPNDTLKTLTSHLVNSPLSVIEWDHEFRVKFWSGQAQAIFGWSEEEIRGKHPGDWRFVHEDDVDSVNRIMEELLRNGIPRNISFNRNYSKDGRIIHCEWYNSIVTDGSGKLVSVLSLIQDVSDRQAMEAQIRQLQKLESIGQLTGGVAHDFNNLLTVILGNAELLTDKLASQPQLREVADTVAEAAQKGAQLTHQLLAFARQQPLSPRPTDINQLVTRMNDLLARTLGEQTELTIKPSTEPCCAAIDPIQLESAILNLSLNARDAMPGGGKLTIETANMELDEDYAAAHDEVFAGPYVMVAVSDSGGGMTPEVIERAFEPFFSTKEVGQGSGLGLAMVFGFLKQSGGHVKIYSEIGEGTTVRMYLPHSGESSDQQVSNVEQSGLEGGEESILVVEDDDLVRQYASAQLRLLGYEVKSASNAREALSVIENSGPFDLLFTDVVMPGGMNGPKLAAQARQIQPGMRVLFTSGYTENAIVHSGRLDPDVLLLSKPYQRATLARLIRHALES